MKRVGHRLGFTQREDGPQNNTLVEAREASFTLGQRSE